MAGTTHSLFFMSDMHFITYSFLQSSYFGNIEFVGKIKGLAFFKVDNLKHTEQLT